MKNYLSSKRLQELVDEYKDYTKTGKKMSYKDFLILFEGLMEFYERHKSESNNLSK